MNHKILRRREVERKTGKCRSSIYDDPTFPKPIPIGAKAVGWLEAEVDDWIEQKIAERDSGAAADGREYLRRNGRTAGLAAKRKANSTERPATPPEAA